MDVCPAYTILILARLQKYALASFWVLNKKEKILYECPQSTNNVFIICLSYFLPPLPGFREIIPGAELMSLVFVL